VAPDATQDYVVTVALGQEAATLTSENPDSAFCRGAPASVSWPALSVPDLTGYQVVALVTNPMGEAVDYEPRVPSDQTSEPITIPSPQGLDSIFVYPVIGGQVGPESFAGAPLDIQGPPTPLYLGVVSLGNGTVTMPFYYSPGDFLFQPGTLTLTATPGGESQSTESSSSVSLAFSGLPNGVSYTFHETLANACGTETASYGPFTPEDLVAAPPAQSSATTGQPYSQGFSTTGGTGPYEFVLESGALPPGISLSPSTGVLSGTPTAPGPYSFVVDVYDLGDPQLGPAVVSFTLTVGQAPSITSTCPGSAETGTAYSCTVDTSAFPTAALSASGLPAGLAFTDNGDGTGTIAGTPAPGTGGTYAVQVTATNGVRPNATLGFALTVDQSPAFLAASPPLTVIAGRPYTYDFAASGFPAPTYSLGGGAPSWLAVDTTTGAVSGVVPTVISSFSYSVTASNSVGNPVTARPFTVTVTPVVSLVFSGSLSYTNGGPITSGSLKVEPSTGAITSVTGRLTIPGVTGGTATVSVDIARVFGLYIGVVTFSDPEAHLGTVAVVLSATLTRTATGQLTGTASGLYSLRPYTLKFTV
jgi:hypothetical protein